MLHQRRSAEHQAARTACIGWPMLTLRSSEAEASSVPSSFHARRFTQPSCPCSVVSKASARACASFTCNRRRYACISRYRQRYVWVMGAYSTQGHGTMVHCLLCLSRKVLALMPPQRPLDPIPRCIYSHVLPAFIPQALPHLARLQPCLSVPAAGPWHCCRWMSELRCETPRLNECTSARNQHRVRAMLHLVFARHCSSAVCAQMVVPCTTEQLALRICFHEPLQWTQTLFARDCSSSGFCVSLQSLQL